MKLFPDAPVDFSQINEIIMHPIRSRLLRTGIELGVFDRLTGPVTSLEVSEELGTHPENTGHLLDGLTAIGLLEKSDGRYSNGDVARTFLISGTDTYLGELFDQYQRTLVDVLDNLTDMVRHGPPQQPDGTGPDDTGYLDQYASVLANAARGGHAQVISRIARELPEFPRMRRLLDVGGGPGIIAMTILDEHPTMTGVVFEQPAMAEVAMGFIGEYGMEDRLEVIGGDFMTDEVDRTYDLILTSFCLYFGKHCLDRIVRKIFDSLDPGGVFMSVHEGLTDEGTSPEILVLPEMGFNMRGRSMAFHHGDISDSMRQCGFSSVESRPELTPFGEVELVVGRK